MTDVDNTVLTKDRKYNFDYNLMLVLYFLLIYTTVNVFFPVWVLPQSFIPSLLLLFVFLLFLFPLFFIFRYLFPEKYIEFNLASLSGMNIRTNSKNFIFKKWKWFLYLVIYSSIFIFLFSNLSLNISLGGDAGQILYIVNLMSIFFNFNNRIHIPILGLPIFGLVIIFLYILPFAYTVGLAFLNHHSNTKINKIKAFIKWFKIPLIFIAVGVEFLYSYIIVSFFYAKPQAWLMSNILLFFRYPPIFFILGSILFSLFSWNSFILKFEVFIFMILSSIFLKLLFDELSEFIPIKNRNIKFILEIGVVLTYLFFPVIIQYSTFYYIASGIAFAVSITSWLLIKYLKSKNDLYLTLLIIIAGIGALIERPVTFQILGISFILVIFFVTNRQMILNKKYFLRLIVSLIGSASFFLVSYVLVILIPDVNFSQHVRSVSEFYFPNIINGKLFDYVIRAKIEMGLIGSIAYICLILVFLIGIYKKSIPLASIFILFVFSYIPYILDTGWAHNVDRFMVPIMIFIPLSIYLLILQILSLYETMYEKIKLKKFSRSITKSLKVVSPVTFVIIIFILLVGYGAVNANQSKESLIENDYLPLSSMSHYLKKVLTAKDKVYFWSGITPLWFYFKQYNVKGVIINWKVWTSIKNQTVKNMIAFFKSENITYFMFSNTITFGLFSTTLIQSLISNPKTSSYEFIHKDAVGKNSLFLWKVL